MLGFLVRPPPPHQPHFYQDEGTPFSTSPWPSSPRGRRDTPNGGAPLSRPVFLHCIPPPTSHITWKIDPRNLGTSRRHRLWSYTVADFPHSNRGSSNAQDERQLRRCKSIGSESSWNRKVTRQHPFNLWTSGIHNNNKRKNVHPACVCSESGFRSYVWLVSEETVPLCSAAQKIWKRK